MANQSKELKTPSSVPKRVNKKNGLNGKRKIINGRKLNTIWKLKKEDPFSPKIAKSFSFYVWSR